MRQQNIRYIVLTLLVTLFAVATFNVAAIAQVENPQSGSAGLQGRVPADPPDKAPTITFPANGQTFIEIPIDVTGLCTADLTVKIFKNEVFAGSVICLSNGTYSITIDLFSGTNELVARIYDDLNQAGPDSNKVTVRYDDGTGPENNANRVTITTNYAKRGANPGSTLIWPFTITGGEGPYAISIDWGDGTEDLISREVAGEFVPEHIYEKSGTYKITVKVTDANGQSAFIQVIGIANGPILNRLDIVENPDGTYSQIRTKTVEKFIVWPLYIMLALIISTFWLGRRYELKRLRKKLSSGVRFQ